METCGSSSLFVVAVVIVIAVVNVVTCGFVFTYFAPTLVVLFVLLLVWWWISGFLCSGCVCLVNGVVRQNILAWVCFSTGLCAE